MTKPISITIDSTVINAKEGQTIIEAADRANIYIPRQCINDPSETCGTCRLCTVYVNGSAKLACIQPVEDNMLIENNSERLWAYRQTLR